MEPAEPSSDDFANWNAIEDRTRAEKAFPLLMQQLSSGSLSPRLQQVLHRYVRNQALAWMAADLSYLGTHTLHIVDCGAVRRVSEQVLSSQSEFFGGVFKYSEGKNIDIHLDWLSPIAPSLVAAIEAMKLSGCEAPITEDSCLSLFLTADFILCEQLRSCCLEFIRSRCDQSGALALTAWGLAHALSVRDLAAASEKSVLKHFSQFRLCQEFLDLEPCVLFELLSHRMLNCTSELQVLESIGHWVQHQPQLLQEVRKPELERLLCCVRLGQMLPWQLRAAEGLPAAAECPNFLEYLRTYPMPTVFSARHYVQLIRLDRTRFPHEVALLLCRGCTERPLIRCIVYSHRTDTYDLLSPDGRRVPDLSLMDRNSQEMPIPEICQFACLAVGDRLYLIGGRICGGAPSRMVLCFDRSLAGAGWRDGPWLTQARCRHCCAAVADFVYAAGGVTGNEKPTASVERNTLSGGASAWAAIEPMRRSRADAAAVAHHGRLLVVGGFDGKSHLDSGEIYCPAAGAWTALSGSMSQRRSGLGLVTLGDSAVYALCGQNSRGWRRSIECWEEGRGWKASCKVTVRRSNFGFAVLDDRIYLFGGVNAEGPVSSTEWVDVHQEPALCVQGRPSRLPGVVLGACLLGVEMELLRADGYFS